MYKLKSEKKNITILISNYFAVCGGAEKQISMLAENLSTLGYDVTIITRNKNKTDELFYVNNSKVFSIYVGESKLNKYIYTFKSIKFLLKGEHQQAIIASQYGSNSIIACLYSIFHKTNVIVRGSGREIEIINNSMIKKLFFRILSRKINYIVAINERLGNIIGMALNNRDLDKIKYISNATKLENKADIYNNKNVVCVSRIEPIKGIDILLEVWALLEKRNYNIPLVIVGDGSQIKYLKDKYKFLNTVSWEGKSSNVNQYLDEARILISTSRYEGISNSILEAMSKGVPVIATNNHGNKELIKNNVTGVLTSFEIEEIFNEVIKLYNDFEKLSYIQNNSIEYIKKERNVEDMINKYIEIIEG